jgi:large subunit ribosomal protein L23
MGRCKVKAHDVIRRPVVTEKSNIAREEENLATFAVDPRANKHEIRHAIEELFHVKVLDVRTMRQPRKSRRLGRHVGRRPEWKKAIVRLAEGQSIEFFEGI